MINRRKIIVVILSHGYVILARDKITTVVIPSRDRITTVVILSR